MNPTITLFPANLNLFDGGGTAAGTGTAAPAPAGDGNAGPASSIAGAGPNTGTGAGARDGTAGPFRGGPAPGMLPAQVWREAQLRAWDSQAEQVKALYPGFDLGLEARSRDFRAMLKAGVPMRQAFEVLHMDQIMSARTQAAERALTANIRAKGARPPENGAGAAAGFTVKDGVSRLSAQDRADMARRAARGEVITF